MKGTQESCYIDKCLWVPLDFCRCFLEKCARSIKVIELSSALSLNILGSGIEYSIKSKHSGQWN